MLMFSVCDFRDASVRDFRDDYASVRDFRDACASVRDFRCAYASVRDFRDDYASYGSRLSFVMVALVMLTFVAFVIIPRVRDFP